jgi:predicted nucleotidyltransferase
MTESKTADTLQGRYLAEITRILQKALRGTKCRIYLFGSRASGQNSAASDFDIAIEASLEVGRQLAVARGMLEESSIPLDVDLLELSAASETLRRRVLEQGTLLWSN